MTPLSLRVALFPSSQGPGMQPWKLSLWDFLFSSPTSSLAMSCVPRVRRVKRKQVGGAGDQQNPQYYWAKVRWHLCTGPCNDGTASVRVARLDDRVVLPVDHASKILSTFTAFSREHLLSSSPPLPLHPHTHTHTTLSSDVPLLFRIEALNRRLHRGKRGVVYQFLDMLTCS